MGGDYTRFTFRPENDYTNVLRQQGRVALDADHNELAEIYDRRLRAETLDVLGQCTVPREPADPNDGLPTSFRIYATGAGLAIGRGRVYVDGILAECRGDPQSPEAFDAALGETHHVNPLPWAAQPHFPQHPTLTPPVANRVDLVYLDVWEREVTAIEDPAIREVALGGPDTTTRRQIIWQVKVLEDVGVTTCADAGQLPQWQSIVAPSGGRLTTSTDPAFNPDDEPCTIGPAGGYRGLENRLYRVEIQSPGTIAADENAVTNATARFKWSRDNASLQSAVEKIENFPAAGTDPARTVVRLRTLGRDQVLRFTQNDWVEVLDDYTEFRQESGQMSQITAIDQANRLITLVPQLDLNPNVLDPGVEDPITGENAVLRERHTRVRRWGADALQPVIAGKISLENGIQIELTLAGGGAFHAADYWVFAARTSTGTIELLNTARPRGILHHFGRLALVDWTNDPTQPVVIDCRTPWPPRGGQGCCTVVVNPGESIQQAIDSLPAEGGCVCLKTGVHVVNATVRVDRSNVCIEGESPGTVVRHPIAGPVLHIGSANQQTIERVCVTCVRFELGDAGSPPVVEIDRLSDGAMCECAWSAANEGDTMNTTALLITGSSRVVVERCAFENVLAGVWVSTSGGIEIRDNEVHGPTWEDENGNPMTAGATGIALDSNVTGPCRIAGNVVEEYVQPIVVGQGAARSIVRDNEIVRLGALPEGILPEPPNGSQLGARSFGIDCLAEACEISGNVIGLEVGGHGGIRAAAPLVSVHDNQVRSSVTGPAEQALSGNPLGIFVDDMVGKGDADHCRVCGNTLTGFQNAISVGDSRGSRIVGVEVAHNHIVGIRGAVEQLGSPFADPQKPPTLQPDVMPVQANYAIRCYGLAGGQLAHNQIQSVPAGIVVRDCRVVQVAHNVVIAGVLGTFGYQCQELELTGDEMASLTLAAVILANGQRARVSNHRIADSGWFGVLSIGGSDTVVESSRVSGARVGVAVADEGRPRVGGNTIDECTDAGIFALRCYESVSLTHDDVMHCGSAGLSPFLVDPNPTSPDPGVAVGITVLDTSGSVTVESCRIVDAGRSEEKNEAFAGLVIDLLILLFDHCHIHANEIVGAVDRPGQNNDEIAVMAQAQGNESAHVELIDNMMRSGGVLATYVLGVRHVIFANNRIQHTPQPVFGIGIDNLHMALSLSVSANRVASVRTAAAFLILAPHLSPVANVTTGQWAVSTPPADIIPGPIAQFNIIGV